MVIVWRKRDRQLRQELLATSDHAGRDLHGARLVDLDLRRKQFSGADLHRADLTESDLTSADLSGCNLRHAYLTGTQLCGANLTGAILDHAFLYATNLRGARLEDASLVGVLFDHATTWPAGFAPPWSEVGRWHGRRD